MEGFGAGMRTERGREGEKKRDRGREADRQTGSVGHKEAFTASLGEPAEPRLLLCDWAKSWPGTRREKGDNPRFHMCANVLSGTLPEALLI